MGNFLFSNVRRHFDAEGVLPHEIGKQCLCHFGTAEVISYPLELTPLFRTAKIRHSAKFA